MDVGNAIRRIKREGRIIALNPVAPVGCCPAALERLWVRVDRQQQTIPGYRLLLEANGQIYEYHGRKDDTPILCSPIIEENNQRMDRDKNIDDGWPNETRDQDVILVTPGRNP